MDKKKNWLLKDVKAINKWAGISFAGLLLFVVLSAVKWYLAAGICSAVFAVIAWWTFFSAADGRGRDKEAVSYNLLWGTISVAIMLSAFAVLMLKQRLGI